MGSVYFTGWLPSELAEFQEGPPPHVGWWATIVSSWPHIGAIRSYRWWGGKPSSKSKLKRIAALKSFKQACIDAAKSQT